MGIDIYYVTVTFPKSIPLSNSKHSSIPSKDNTPVWEMNRHSISKSVMLFIEIYSIKNISWNSKNRQQFSKIGTNLIQIRSFWTNQNLILFKYWYRLWYGEPNIFIGKCDCTLFSSYLNKNSTLRKAVDSEWVLILIIRAKKNKSSTPYTTQSWKCFNKIIDKIVATVHKC